MKKSITVLLNFSLHLLQRFGLIGLQLVMQRVQAQRSAGIYKQQQF
jgi:hypothetical protein